MQNTLPFPLPHRGDEAQPLVDYILLAEFDIDKGSTVRHCYPSDSLITETYTLDYFANNMLPEGVHNRAEDWSYMLLHRDATQIEEHTWIHPTQQADSPGQHMLYGLNLVITKYDSTVRRGAIVKALAIFSKYHFIDVFRAPLLFALDVYFSNPFIEILATLFTSLNSIDIRQLPFPNTIHKTLMTRGVLTTQPCMNRLMSDYRPPSWYFNTTMSFYGNRISLTIPLHRTPDEIDITNLSLLIKLFNTNGTMRIYNAILTGQRVLFVGYNHSAYEVSSMVLSAIAMVSPPLLNIIRRTYPYANLTDLSFLNTKGYISGVTNPIFVERYDWWDLLCVLDIPNGTGTVYTPEERKMETLHGKSSGSSRLVGQMTKREEAPHDILDMKFGATLVAGVNEYLGEEWVRQQFYDYTDAILSQANDLRNLRNSAKLSDRMRRQFELNKDRVEAFRKSSVVGSSLSSPFQWLLQGQQMLARLAVEQQTGVEGDGEETQVVVAEVIEELLVAVERSVEVVMTPPSSLDVFEDTDDAYELSPELDETDEDLVTPSQDEGEDTTKVSLELMDHSLSTLILAHLRRLQCECDLSSAYEVEAIYSDLSKYLVDEAALQILLVCLPEYRGGVYLIALGLLHQNPTVRYNAFLILQRLQLYASTRQAFESINGFLLRAYIKQLRKFEDGSLAKDAVMYEHKQSLLRSQKNAMRDKPITKQAGVRPVPSANNIILDRL